MDTSTQFWRDPAMPHVESRRACHSRACYKAHSHPTYSIGAVDEGVSLFTGASDGPVTLHAGTVVFIPAERVHACNPMPDSAWSYQMLHLDASWLHAVRQEYARAEAGHGAAEPIRIVREPMVYQRFCHLNALLFSQADLSDKEAALIEFIGDCDNVEGLRIDMPESFAHQAGALAPVLDFLRQAGAAGVCLGELARMAGMSRYQLIRAFRAATGMTPHAWQLNQRINQARERIRAGEGISEVAYGLGFADQAHFQRVFKAHAGITPGRYRD
jgi:AraC-like DNA-binding protein